MFGPLFRRLVVRKSFPNFSKTIKLCSSEYSRAAMDEAQDNNTVVLLRLLEPLKNVCKNLQTSVFSITSTTSNLSFLSTISDFNDQLAPFLAYEPNIFSNLSQSLSTLHIYLQNLEQSASTGYWFHSLIQCKLINYQISNTAAEMESEIGSWIDRERIAYLANILHDPAVNDEAKVTALREFEIRISSGYERDVQEIILRTKLFNVLESVVCKSRSSKSVREQCANTITALVDFNRDVFIGQVLIGGTMKVLIDMASLKSLQVLSSLIKLIGGPLAYEIESNGYIKTILGLLDSEDDCIRGSALDCVMELASLARMEVIEGLIEEEGLIRKLMEMQKKRTGKSGFAAGILTRFVGKMEMNEGLEMGEMRRLRDEVLRRAREASVSEDEATSIVADVLWGSSPLILH